MLKLCFKQNRARAVFHHLLSVEGIKLKNKMISNRRSPVSHVQWKRRRKTNGVISCQEKKQLLLGIGMKVRWTCFHSISKDHSFSWTFLSKERESAFAFSSGLNALNGISFSRKVFIRVVHRHYNTMVLRSQRKDN